MQTDVKDPNSLVLCPTCSSDNFEQLAPSPYAAVRCRGGQLGIETVTSDDPMTPYKRGEYDQTRGGSPAWRRFHHDVAVANARLHQLEDHLPTHGRGGANNLWVDVGSGTGAFLVQARRR